MKPRSLIDALAQGKHRYFKLAGRDVAVALESLQVIGGGAARPFQSSAPNRLRHARSCYDHAAGEVAVALHDRLLRLGWLEPQDDAYTLSPPGERALVRLGVDCAAARASRRRFAYACLDWSERRVHVAGALGAALLDFMLAKRWLVREIDSRALRVTDHGEACLARIGR